MYLYRCVAGLS